MRGGVSTRFFSPPARFDVERCRGLFNARLGECFLYYGPVPSLLLRAREFGEDICPGVLFAGNVSNLCPVEALEFFLHKVKVFDEAVVFGLVVSKDLRCDELGVGEYLDVLSAYVLGQSYPRKQCLIFCLIFGCWESQS